MSEPLSITFRQARDADACAASYRRMADHVGGVKKHGHDTPVPVETVLDVLGLDDALRRDLADGQWHRAVGLGGWGWETVISDPPSIGGGVWIERNWWRR